MNPQGLIGTAVPWLSFALVAFAFALAVKPVLHYVSSFRSTNVTSWRTPPDGWLASKADFLVVGLALISLLLTIGVGRGGRGWEPGLEMHYSGVALPLVFWSYLSLVLFWHDRYARIAAGILALIFVCSYLLSKPMADGGGKSQKERRRAFERDLRGGIPVDEIINRNITFLNWVDTEDSRRKLRNGLLLLRAEAIRDNNKRLALQPYLSVRESAH
jgi:hypothetical protein